MEEDRSEEEGCNALYWQGSDRSNHSMTGYGDWSEQLSSSGKKYYYNRRTDASSWEKPREWVEAERSRQEKSRDWSSDHDKLKSTPAKLHCDRNNRSSQVVLIWRSYSTFF